MPNEDLFGREKVGGGGGEREKRSHALRKMGAGLEEPVLI